MLARVRNVWGGVVALEKFLGGRIILHAGDCREVLVELEANSLDACVTDPPYHLVSIVKRFANATLEHEVFAADNPARQYGSLSRGFMGQVWDGGDIAFDAATWSAVLRVLKPGAHAAVFCIPKHVGRVQMAMQEAGFEFRDVVLWLFGSGFPKSHDISKAIDREAGAERDKVRVEGVHFCNPKATGGGRDGMEGARRPWIERAMELGYHDFEGPESVTEEARQWEGWGTALKPACELIVLARKPLSEATVAANVLRWGTGAINVDGCRIGFSSDDDEAKSKNRNRHADFNSGPRRNTIYGADNRPRVANGNYDPPGRWPANVIHDGSAEVVAAFPEVNNQIGGPSSKSIGGNGIYGGSGAVIPVGYGDSGSAARFYYTAKADSDDRLGSKHPTVKPLDLLQYLCRLIVPEGGTVLDCFAGTGTTAEAAFREGMYAVMIEAEPQYCDDIRRRMRLVLAGPDERARESIKARNLPRDDGPLFAWAQTDNNGGQNESNY